MSDSIHIAEPFRSTVEAIAPQSEYAGIFPSHPQYQTAPSNLTLILKLANAREEMAALVSDRADLIKQMQSFADAITGEDRCAVEGRAIWMRLIDVERGKMMLQAECLEILDRNVGGVK